MLGRILIPLAFVAGIFTTTNAHAQACSPSSLECATRAVQYSWQAPNGLNLMFDTGWLPGGSPLQVRLYIAATGYSRVELAGDAGASWPSPILFGHSPRAGASSVTVDYGFELRMQFRFNVRVLGQNIGWEGDIPIPNLPSDLRMNDVEAFDSFLLPGAPGRPARVSDSTQDIRILTFNALGSFLPIPGLTGGITLDARARVEGAYQTTSIAVSNATPATMRNEGVPVRLRPTQGADYGGRAETTTTPAGELQQTFAIVITPKVVIDIFGFGFDIPLFSIPINVLNETRNVSFPARALSFPLPDIGPVAEQDFGEVQLGTPVTKSLALSNAGEDELDVTIVSLPEGVTATTQAIALAPGNADAIELSFDAAVLGELEGHIVLVTNDPDESMLSIPVRAFVYAEGEEPTPDGGVRDGGTRGDAGVDEDGSGLSGTGCGCHVVGDERTSPAQALGFALLLGLALVRRRRR